MPKLKAVLEKNVEWIALGLAGLWILWLAWAYGISQPVFVTIGSETYTAADLDKTISDLVNRDLLPKVNSTAVPAIAVPNLVGDFAAAMDAKPSAALATNNLFNSVPTRPLEQYLPPTANPMLPGGVLAQQGTADDSKMDAFPQIPPPTILDLLYVRDQVIIPPLQPKVDMAAMQAANPLPGMIDPSGVPGLTGFPTGNLAPAPMPIVAPGAGGIGLAATAGMPGSQLKDIDAVTVFAKFNEKALDEALAQAKIPQVLRTTRQYVEVQLVRQEQLPDGSWGNETEIAPLPINAPNFDIAKFREHYVAWATQQQNQPVVLTPPFYQSASPMPKWRHPSQVPGNTQLVGLPADPAQRIQQIAQEIRQLDQNTQLAAAEKTRQRNQLLNALPVEQRQAVFKLMAQMKQYEDQQKKLQDQQNRINNRDTTRDRSSRNRDSDSDRSSRNRDSDSDRSSRNRDRDSSRSRSRDRDNNAAQDAALLREMFAQAAPMGGNNPFPPGMGGGPYVAPPGMLPTDVMPPGMTGGTTMPLNVARPGGVQDVLGNVVLGEFDLWAHDETIEPGKTYRYKMRLVIRNPVFSVTTAVKNPDLAKPLELPADKTTGWSEWTKPIKTKPRVQLFLAGGSLGGKEVVRFDVYTFQKGKNNKSQPITVGVGDMIGALDKDSQIDYTTGWTVADIRTVGGDTRVTLVDDAGRQEVRTSRGDGNNTDHRELEQEVKPPMLPPGMTPGMMPGLPPGVTPGTLPPGMMPPAPGVLPR